MGEGGTAKVAATLGVMATFFRRGVSSAAAFRAERTCDSFCVFTEFLCLPQASWCFCRAIDKKDGWRQLVLK